MMTVELLKQALPRNLQCNASQELADKINNLAVDPETADEIRANFITYSKILTEGKYKTENYLEAIQYATYKLMGYSNKDAYAKTFPDRWMALTARGASDKDISAYVAAYHKNKLVNSILEQAVIPTWLLNQDAFQKAINTQLDLMANSQSDKVRTDAANSLLTHLKPPEKKKIELDVNVKQEGGIADLRATMEELARQQLDLIQKGAGAQTVGRTPIVMEGEAIEVEALPVIPVPLNPQAQLPAPAPAPTPAPAVQPFFKVRAAPEIPVQPPQTQPKLSLFGDFE